MPLRRFALASLLLGSTACAGSGGGLTLTPVQHTSEKPSNVAVYFRVETKKGEPVGGLEAKSFRIFEDEALVSEFESKQTILNPEVAASHYTLLLVDMSGSVVESKQSAAIGEAALAFTQRVGTNNQVAVYAFDGSEQIHAIAPFSKDAAKVQGKVAKLAAFVPEDPSTNLHGAVVAALGELETALNDADNPLRFGTLVVFTDGTDRAARVSGDEMKSALDSTGYDVFAIGLGAELSEEDLDKLGRSGSALATEPGAVAAAFEAVADRIEAVTRSYYLLSYCSPARAGSHEVRIEAVVSETTDGKVKEKTGSLSTEFDAEGFGPKCDPNKEPSFDTTAGAAADGNHERDERPKWLRFFGGKNKNDAGGESDGDGEAKAGDGKAKANGGVRIGGNRD